MRSSQSGLVLVRAEGRREVRRARPSTVRGVHVLTVIVGALTLLLVAVAIDDPTRVLAAVAFAWALVNPALCFAHVRDSARRDTDDDMLRASVVVDEPRGEVDYRSAPQRTARVDGREIPLTDAKLVVSLEVGSGSWYRSARLHLLTGERALELSTYPGAGDASDAAREIGDHLGIEALEEVVDHPGTKFIGPALTVLSIHTLAALGVATVTASRGIDELGALGGLLVIEGVAFGAGWLIARRSAERVGPALIARVERASTEAVESGAS